MRFGRRELDRAGLAPRAHMAPLVSGSTIVPLFDERGSLKAAMHRSETLGLQRGFNDLAVAREPVAAAAARLRLVPGMSYRPGAGATSTAP